MSEVPFFRGTGRWPRVYVAPPMSGLGFGVAEDNLALAERAEAVAKAGRFVVVSPWRSPYPDDPGTKPNGTTFRLERNRLLECQLLLVVGAGPSYGVGRLLQVAEDNLIEVLFAHPQGDPPSRMTHGETDLRLFSKLSISRDFESKFSRWLERRRPDLKKRRASWPTRYFPPVATKAIESLRETRGGNISDVAKELGLPRGAVKTIESGVWVPSLYVLRLFALHFGVSAASLVASNRSPGVARFMETVHRWALRRGVPADQEEMVLASVRHRGDALDGGEPSDTELDEILRSILECEGPEV